VYLLLHAGEDEGHRPAGVRRRHRGAVHELGAAQRELPHGGDGAAGGAQRQPPVPVNSRSTGAPRELGPCGYTMLRRSQKYGSFLLHKAKDLSKFRLYKKAFAQIKRVGLILTNYLIPHESFS
jgi:hypothetical protein